MLGPQRPAGDQQNRSQRVQAQGHGAIDPGTGGALGADADLGQGGNGGTQGQASNLGHTPRRLKAGGGEGQAHSGRPAGP